MTAMAGASAFVERGQDCQRAIHATDGVAVERVDRRGAVVRVADDGSQPRRVAEMIAVGDVMVFRTRVAPYAESDKQHDAGIHGREVFVAESEAGHHPR